MPGETALDRMWDRLDFLTDQLIDGPRGRHNGEATGVAWCISQFYGGDIERVRLLEMGRRAIRERGRAKTARRTRGAV